MSNRRQRNNQWERRGGRSGSSALLAAVCAALLLVGFVASRLTSGSATAVEAAMPRLSELMTSGDASSVTPDWVELVNDSDAALDLTGWALVTASKPNKALPLAGVRLESGERLVIDCDGGGSSADGRLHAPFRLAAAGETVLLLNAHGTCVDSVTTPSLHPGQSYCRDEGGEWTISEHPTPGEANHPGAAGEDAETDLTPGAVEISEAMSHNVTFCPDADGNFYDYIELHNTTGEAVDLKNWALSDHQEKPRKWELPAVTLPGDGYLLVRCSGESKKDDIQNLQAGFKLDRDGETLWLTDPDGIVSDRVDLPGLSADEAWSRTASGWETGAAPTPGRANDPREADAEVSAVTGRNALGVFINEIMASSSDSDDWIELYNASGAPVDLGGCGLSDNAAKPRKWQFPAGTVIQPGEYLGVFAGKDGTATGGSLRADFALGAAGGYSVTLADGAGQIIDRLFVPQQYAGISYGRLPSLNAARYFTQATPGAANAQEGYYGRAPQPEFSVSGGLFVTGDQFQVSITAPEGCRAYYTTDLSDPTEASAPVGGPIAVSGTTILRARAYKEGYLPSIMDSRSYLYDVKNGGGTVHVVSLVTDPRNLYDEQTGIFAMGPNATAAYPYGSKGKGANFWMDWEREAHVEIFLPDGTQIISQECGTKLFGAYSRPKEKKPLKIIARSEYGSNRFNAKVFSKRDYTDYKMLLLRTGSQDATRTHMRDAVLQQLAADTPMFYQEYEIAVLYLNGEYWGHYNIRERINAASICRWEGWEGDEDKIDLVRGNETVMQGSNDSMAQLLAWLGTHDPSSDEAYEAIDSVVDIDSYIEYIAIEMYTGNTDTLNAKRYRNPQADGKWRWVMFDLDCAFDFDTNSVSRWLDPEGMGRGKNTDNRLIVAFMKNPRLRERFLTYLGGRMATTYNADYILPLIEEYYHAVQPITAEDLERWDLKQKDYDDELKHLVSYTKTRSKRMLQFLKDSKFLGLTKSEMERYFATAMAQQGLTYDTIEKP